MTTQQPGPDAETSHSETPESETPEPSPRKRPEQTRDDTDAGWGERPDESEHDRWLREQRPPHWE